MIVIKAVRKTNKVESEAQGHLAEGAISRLSCEKQVAAGSVLLGEPSPTGRDGWVYFEPQRKTSVAGARGDADSGLDFSLRVN